MKIYALIITYNPNIDILDKVIRSLADQVAGICIVDNFSFDSDGLTEFCRDIFMIRLDKNYGIAKATNVGLQFLQNKGADFVLLSDQDTIYPIDYLMIFQNYINKNNIDKVAAYAPVLYDVVSAEYKPIYVEKNKILKQIQITQNPTFVFQAIASGFIIDMKKYKLVGGMNEDLFIDYVDFEWCWKVKSMDLKILCVPSLIITHTLGSEVVSIGSKKISTRNFIRYYYLTRNTFYLALFSPYLKGMMKIQLFLKSCSYLLGYPVLCKPRLKILFYCLKGVYDGIRKKLGEIDC